MRVIRTIRILIFLFFLFGMGIVGLQSGLHKRHNFEQHHKAFLAPVTIPIQEFARQQPTAGWFRVTNVTTNASEAVFRQNDPDKYSDHGDGTGRIEKVLVPAYDGNEYTQGVPAKVVLVTDHLRLRKVVNEMQKMGLGTTLNTTPSGAVEKPSDTSDTEESTGKEESTDKESTSPKVDDAVLTKWIHQNKDRLVETRTVEGLVRSEEDLDYDDSKLYKALKDDIAPRHVILEEGVTPTTESNGALEIGVATAMLILGGVIVLAIIGGAFAGLRSR
jgi:hypothetical protein